MMTQKISKPPPPEEVETAKKELDEACEAVAAASKKNAQAATRLKRTISDPAMKRVRLPTPSEIDLEKKS